MNENRPERKRQNDQTKQEVIGVKRVEKNAKESEKGHQNRQNATRRTRKRTRKGINIKANIWQRATREGNTTTLLKTD